MPRQERERRYIAQYMKETFPEGDYQLNVELGAIPQEYIDRHGPARAAALFRPTRPRVDAVKWLPDRYYLIEAKIYSIKNGIGDLIYYRGEAKKALDLPYYEGQPIMARLVIPFMIDWMRSAAISNEIEVVVVEYPWIRAYVRERQHYFSAEYRAERDEKLRLRKVLGVE